MPLLLSGVKFSSVLLCFHVLGLVVHVHESGVDPCLMQNCATGSEGLVVPLIAHLAVWSRRKP